MTTTAISVYTQIRPAIENSRKVVYIGSSGKVTIEKDVNGRLHCFAVNDYQKPMDYKIYKSKGAVAYAQKWARPWIIKFK